MSFSFDDLLSEGLDHAANTVHSGGGESLPIPTNDDELHAAVLHNFGINIPRQKVCAHHVAPFTAFADAFFARHPLAIWLASRGFGGKSLTLSLLSLAEATFLGSKVNLLGGSGEQSVRVLKYMNGEEMPGKLWFAPNAPVHLLQGGLEKGLLKRETTLVNGGYINALMASSASVRGPHPQRLRMDEIDEMEQNILDSALGQPMSKEGVNGYMVDAQVVCSSTHHYANGTMTEMMRRAAENGWPIFEWCYRENLVSNGGWLPDKEVETKKSIILAAMWETEYENQEPNPEGRAIDTEKCKAAFMRDLTLWNVTPELKEDERYPKFEFEGSNGEEIIIEEPYEGGEPIPVCGRCSFVYHLEDKESRYCPRCDQPRPKTRGGYYSTGTDWAKKKDHTIIKTFRIDVRPVRMVAWKRMGRLPWPVMVKSHEDRVAKYPGAAYHDATGIGDALGDYMIAGSEGIIMQGRVRYELLQEYILAIESGRVIFPFIRRAFLKHSHASVDDVFRYGEKFHVPDEISAGALAWLGAPADGGEILIPGVNVMTGEDSDEIKKTTETVWERASKYMSDSSEG